VAGPLEFSQVGILAALLTPLANAGIPVFVLSTFETDSLLVKANDLDRAVVALRTAGHEIDAEPRLELTLGQVRAVAPRMPVPQQAKGSETAGSLAVLQNRCRRKAEAARGAAETQHRIHEGTDVDLPADSTPLDPQLSTWASRLTDGYYWMCSAVESPSEIAAIDDVAGCFDTVAEALALADESEGPPKALERALAYLAEAQSALRWALQKLGLTDDPEQNEAYEWLRTAAARHRIYLRRHMRADDLAEPSSWPTILAGIEEARTRGRKTPLAIEQLERIRRHKELIANARASEGDWAAIFDAVDRLIDAGMPASNRDLRELLLPIIEELPERDDLPRSIRLVLRELDRFLATRTVPAAGSTEQGSTLEVREVARLLAGKSLVLIGGERRRGAQEALRRAFGLAAVYWIATKEHQSFETFEPLIARADVALVLLAIRWSSHGFGEVRQLCDRHAKPLVRLPGGFNPNQVATQILAQCSEQLSGDR
jgi:hypothetical protein